MNEQESAIDLALIQKRAPVKGVKKTTVCRLILLKNPKLKVINGKPYFNFFNQSIIWAKASTMPLNVLNINVGFKAKITGGGLGSASIAVSSALAKAIALTYPELRITLKKAGMLKVDSRRAFQKIAGQPKSRKKRQRSKR